MPLPFFFKAGVFDANSDPTFAKKLLNSLANDELLEAVEALLMGFYIYIFFL